MNINETLENLRVSYRHSSLDVNDCHKDPKIQFDSWFAEAVKSQCDEPNAFVLSTVLNNRPRGRVVLLKGIHQDEFVFYSNYKSAKGEELEQNSSVAMTFLWLPLQRQVRIEGVIKKVDSSLSDDYFHKRPRGNQIGAIASPQSKKVASRIELENLFKEAESRLNDKETLDRPLHWGGYSIRPDYFEFWQGRESRLHDRIVYEKVSGAWGLARLAP
jgi:pyridoxamine 5'-phosphate oxidase